jgi:hypothetical protein
LCQFDAKSLGKSLRGLIEFAHPIPILENFARLGAIRRSDNAVPLH